MHASFVSNIYKREKNISEDKLNKIIGVRLLSLNGVTACGKQDTYEFSGIFFFYNDTNK